MGIVELATVSIRMDQGCRFLYIHMTLKNRILLFVFAFTAFELHAQNARSASADRTSAGSREDISVWAGKMIDETNRARQAIKDGKEQAAMQHVNRAEGDLRQVESRANGSTLVPLYHEFVSVSILNLLRRNTKLASRQERRMAAKAAPAKTAPPWCTKWRACTGRLW
jgi:hypothetical protein